MLLWLRSSRIEEPYRKSGNILCHNRIFQGIFWNVLELLSSTRQDVFCKKNVVVSFAKFTEKYLCQSHFFKESCRLRLSWNSFFDKTLSVAASEQLFSSDFPGTNFAVCFINCWCWTIDKVPSSESIKQ